MMTGKRISVIGGGAWGSALAVHWAAQSHVVRQWVRSAERAEIIRAEGSNRHYLPDVPYPENLVVEHSIAASLEQAEIIVVAIPAQFARSVYRQLAPVCAADTPVLLTCKGVEHDSLALPAEVCAAELGRDRPIAVLSGPSFARELAAGKPTAVAVAATDPRLARELQLALASRSLRLYTNGDPVGVQLAGALKNVIAIAVGVSQGLEMGANSAAGLIARGLGEISRLGVALGGRLETFQGLAGIGDLVLTCYGTDSRNRHYGQLLGQGKTRAEIDATLAGVAEGVATSRAARTLAERHRVATPIIDEICRVLFEGLRPLDAVERLLSRPLIAEDSPSFEVPR